MLRYDTLTIRIIYGEYFFTSRSCSFINYNLAIKHDKIKDLPWKYKNHKQPHIHKIGDSV